MGLQDIIRNLERELAQHLKDSALKTEGFQRALQNLKGINNIDAVEMDEKVNVDNPDYIGYPINGSVFEKFQFFQSTINRVWRKNEFIAFIKDIEEHKQFVKTTKDLDTITRQLVKSKKLFSMIFSDSRIYTYYTTEFDWLKKDNNKWYLDEMHMPPKGELDKLKDPSITKVNEHD